MPKPLKNAVLYQRQAPTSAKPLGDAPRTAPAPTPAPAPVAPDVDAVIAAFMSKLRETRGRTGGVTRLEHMSDAASRYMAMNAARARWGKRKVAKSGIKAG